MVYIDLILNLTLLVALSVLSGFIDRRWPRDTWPGVLLQGVLFGVVAVIGMLRPLVVGPGLLFDGRSIVISLCALFFGHRAVSVTSAMAAAYRLALGGPGAFMGVSVILASSVIGLLARHYMKPNIQPPSTSQLFLLGLSVHAAMAALMFTLPKELAMATFKQMVLPVIALYPLATILAGKILSDQAERSISTKALQESDERYRKSFQDHSAVKLLIDPNTADIIDSNKAAEQFYGWPREKLEQMKITDINTLSLEEIRQEMEKARGGKKMRFEFRHRLADGSIKDVEVFSARIKTKSAEFIHSIIHDITERRRAEAAVRESQERQHRYAELLSNLISEKDFIPGEFESSIRRITESAARLLKTERVSVWSYSSDYSRILCVDLYELGKNKHNRGEILQASKFPSYTASHKSGRVIAAEDVFSDPRTSSIPHSYYEDYEIKSLLDAPVWIQDRLVALLSFENVGDKRRWLPEEENIALTLAAYVSICYEAAERRKAEEELRTLSKELETRVAERTTELQESQLALLNVVDDLNKNARKLDALNKELEAFAYSVSHDLRAPLRSIDGFSAAILEDYHNKLDDTGKGHLERVRRAAQLMGELIDDILKLSRVSKAAFQSEPVNLSEIAKEIADNCRKYSGGKTVKIKIEKDIIAKGDRALLQIAMTNLINNAFKFSGKQTNPLIEFRAYQKDAQNIYCIRDNGVGFDMTYVEKIFGPFQRLHTQDEFPGTGIGLATVRRIINRHGGRIWAEGEVGKGATFYFTLPEG